MTLFALFIPILCGIIAPCHGQGDYFKSHVLIHPGKPGPWVTATVGEVWPKPIAGLDPDWSRYRADAVRFGYPEMEDNLLLSTVRLRFRPRHEGPLDSRDMGIMADLAARYPARRA